MPVPPRFEVLPQQEQQQPRFEVVEPVQQMLPDDYSAPYGMMSAEQRPGIGADFLDMTAGGINSFMENATLGLWPHLQAANIARLGMGSEAGPGAAYQAGLETVNENMDYFDETANPWLRGAVEIGGAVAPAVLFKGAPFLSVPRAQTALGNLARQSIAGGILGGAGALGYGFLEGTGDLNERVENAIDLVPYGAGLGAIAPPLAAAGGALGRAVGGMFRSAPRQEHAALSSLRGVYDEMGEDIPDGIVRQFDSIPSGASPFSEEALTATRNLYDDLVERLYARIDASGVRVSQNEFLDALGPVIDRINDALPLGDAPQRMVERMIERAGMAGADGIPLGTIERWRQNLGQNINELYGSRRGGEAKLLEELRDSIDERILSLTETAGPAREAYITTIRVRALQDAATRATTRAAQRNIDYNEAFRSELTRISNNNSLWKRFSPEQQEAITRAIRSQGPLAGISRLVDKLFPSRLGRTIASAGGLVAGEPMLAAPYLIGTAHNMTQSGKLNRALGGVMDSVAPPVVPSNAVQQMGGQWMTAPAAGAEWVRSNWATGGGF